MADYPPPSIIEGWHCPKCARFRASKFMAHAVDGRWCSGAPVRSSYLLVSDMHHDQLRATKVAMRKAADRYARQAQESVRELDANAGGLDLSPVIRDGQLAVQFRQLAGLVSLEDMPAAPEQEA